jgi:hypothetical protein
MVERLIIDAKTFELLMLEPQALSQESIIGKLFVTAECEGD